MARAITHQTTNTPARESTTPFISRLLPFKKWPFLFGILVAFIAVWICILAWKWPFTQNAVMKSLQQGTHKPVHIGAFHPTFFPPGYVAENIRLASESSNSGTLTMTVRKLVIAADYSDILLMRKNIERVSIIGLHLTVPSGPSDSESQNQSASTHQTPPKLSEIRHVKIENSVVEFSSPEPDGDPLKITAKDVAFDGVTRTGPASFRAELAANEPSGAIHSTGQLGPWNWDDAGQTPLTGSFTFNRADLSTVGNIEGRLNAQGRFSGPLHHVACSGTVDVPQFGTSDGSHTLPLSTTFHATVNGLNGDTTLDDAESRLNRTVIKSQGEIKKDSRQAGKTAHLRLRVDEGQVDDLLLLFTRSRYSSMTGTISLRVNVELPPGAPDFLKRLRLQGDFGMSDSRFTKASTQAPINHLSKSAEGMSKGEEKEDTRTVLSDITGHVSAQNGIATLSRVSFTVPNANAKMFGTYNLLDKAVHLEGTLRTTGKISDTTSGLKAGLLKVISPFLKKHSVTVVPFKITGTAQNSTVALDLARKQRF